MGIGVSIFLIAIGAILAFAVDVQVSGVDLQMVGWILMILGAVGIILTLIFWAPRRHHTVPEHRTYQDGPPAPPR